MSKHKKCYNISEECIATISRIQSQTATPESLIVEKYLTHCISQEVEITAAERYHFRRKHIIDSIDSVLRLFGIIEISGGIQDKFRTALYMAQGNHRGQNREYRNGIMETSIFEILETIREWDINIWKDLTSHMAHFGKIRHRYFQLYPKLNFPKQKQDILYNNNTITNSVTQSTSILKAPQDSDLPDDQYLTKKRKSKSPHLDTKV